MVCLILSVSPPPSSHTKTNQGFRARATRDDEEDLPVTNPFQVAFPGTLLGSCDPESFSGIVTRKASTRSPTESTHTHTHARVSERDGKLPYVPYQTSAQRTEDRYVFPTLRLYNSDTQNTHSNAHADRL